MHSSIFIYYRKFSQTNGSNQAGPSKELFTEEVNPSAKYFANQLQKIFEQNMQPIEEGLRQQSALLQRITDLLQEQAAFIKNISQQLKKLSQSNENGDVVDSQNFVDLTNHQSSLIKYEDALNATEEEKRFQDWLLDKDNDFKE